jgi:hypothetical protein
MRPSIDRAPDGTIGSVEQSLGERQRRRSMQLRVCRCTHQVQVGTRSSWRRRKERSGEEAPGGKVGSGLQYKKVSRSVAATRVLLLGTNRVVGLRRSRWEADRMTSMGQGYEEGIEGLEDYFGKDLRIGGWEDRAVESLSKNRDRSETRYLQFTGDRSV